MRLLLLRTAILLSLVLSSLFGNSQDKYVLGLYPSSSCTATIHGIALGFAEWKTECTANVNGLRVELIGMGFGMGFYGSLPKDGQLFDCESPNFDCGQINGLNLSLTGTLAPYRIDGVSIGGIAQLSQECNGMMVSGFGNFTSRMRGLQLSLFENWAGEGRGVQISLLRNKALDMRGIQIGLWNTNGKRSLPFINWQFRPNPQD